MVSNSGDTSIGAEARAVCYIFGASTDARAVGFSGLRLTVSGSNSVVECQLPPGRGTILLLFPKSSGASKRPGTSIVCQHRLGGLLKYYKRAA